ncbi:hypothetical protein [Catellatospora sichuanensis]|uniref:hypothetical protein n=1 Tax=Catellatospora sichuanensis TaxID=1969805 RepID=UPI0011828735|nr:hypothetical protein [Catellatospora sichuanensis]
MNGQDQWVDHEQLTTHARRVVAAAAATTWMSGERADPAEAALQTALAELAELLGISDGSGDDPAEQVPEEVTLDLLYGAAATLHDEGYRVSLLIDLLPHLTAAQLREVVALLPELADYPRRRLVAALAGRLDAEQVEAVFGSVMTMQTRDDFVNALAALLPQLAQSQRDIAVSRALRQLTGHPHRVNEFLVALAPNLTGPELAAALERFAAATPPSERTTTLTWIAAYLTPDQRNDALDLVLARQDGNGVAIGLGTLAAHLDADQLQRALAVAAVRPDSGHRARALTGLIPHLPEGRRPAAIADAVRAVLAAGSRNSISNIALPDLLPQLGPDQIQLVLDMVQAQQHELRRGWHLEVLAPYLTPAQLRQAFEVAASATNPTDRYAALAAIIPQLGPDVREAAVDLAITALRSHDGWAGLDPLVAAMMTPRQRDTTLGIAASRVDYANIVTGLAAHLDPAQLDRALTVGLDAVDEEQHLAILVALAPYLEHDRLHTALSALEAAPDPYVRADALRLAAAQMPAVTRPAAAGAALRAAGQIADPDDRALALTRLADLVTPDERRTVLAHAYTAAMAVDEEFYRLMRLVDLVPACLTSAPTAPTARTQMD